MTKFYFFLALFHSPLIFVSSLYVISLNKNYKTNVFAKIENSKFFFDNLK
jgi:hypothetical protein